MSVTQIDQDRVARHAYSRDATGGNPDSRVPALDGLRGVAILVVVIHNAAFVIGDSDAWMPKVASAVSSTGWVGVQLFFVLSGFLITSILLGSRADGRYFRTFYTRRALRIFPLYYAFLVVAFAVVPLLSVAAAWSATARMNQVWYWTYLSNWSGPFGRGIPGLSHFWSLAVEEQFYLLWPVLVYRLVDRRLFVICVSVVVATPLIRYAMHLADLPSLSLYEFTVARWDALAVGAMLALSLREERLRRFLMRRGSTLALCGLAVLIAWVSWRHGFHQNDLPVEVIGQTLIAVLAAWLVLSCALPETPATRVVSQLCSRRFLRLLGKYSYAIYVLHFPIHLAASRYAGEWVNGADTNWRFVRLLVYVVATLLASMVAAVISWRLLEKPFLDLKHRWAPRRETQVVFAS